MNKDLVKKEQPKWQDCDMLCINNQMYFRNDLFKEIWLSREKEDGVEAPHLKSFWEFLADWLDESKDYILQKTSGSTGTPKVIKIPKYAMLNSAKATCEFFGLRQNHTALLCLSTDYIGGKMMVVRALRNKLNLQIVKPSNNPLKEISPTEVFDFAAMVPSQLYGTVKSQRLHMVANLIIGGAPVNVNILPYLQSGFHTSVYATYGMTETVSHIALKPLSKEAIGTPYTVLDNVAIEVDERNCLKIHAPNVSSKPVQTNDVVKIINEKQFEYLGRYDNVINSGGYKIHPESLETQIQSFLDEKFILGAMPDEKLGERLIIVLEVPNQNLHNQRYETDKLEKLKDNLDPYQVPKKIYFLDKFVKTPNGKINRRETLAKLRKKQ